MTLNALLPYFSGEDEIEPVPPQTHGFMADVDAALEQQIFDLPQRERIARL